MIRCGSIAAAASEVNLTASAVGLQLRQLERYFGKPLFDRSGRTVRPLPVALELAAAVSGTLDVIEALRSRAHVDLLGRIRLGTIESAQIALLPHAIRSLRQSVPQLEVQCTRGVSRQLVSEVSAGRLDAAVVVRPEGGGSRRLHWTLLQKESFVLVAPPGTRSRNVAQLLASHDWIRLDRSATGGRIASAFVQSLCPGKRHVLELPGTDAIVATVAQGGCVSVIPELRETVRRVYPVVEIALGAVGPTRQITYVCRAADAEDRRISTVLDAFALAVVQSRRAAVPMPE